MLFFFSCLSTEKSIADSSTGDVFSPRSEMVEHLISPGEELRWILEGTTSLEANDADGMVGVEVLYGTEHADSQVDVTLFDGAATETILFEKQLRAESGAQYQETILCNEGCSFRYITKAIHSSGTEATTLKIIFRLDQSIGELLITNVQ
jgi:hypothetical protein